MNKLSNDKRNQLILTVLVTVTVIAGLWLGLVRKQQHTLAELASRKKSAAQKLQVVKQTIENADLIEGQLAEASNQLAKVEETMASGDLYSWAITTIRQFKTNYKVDIPQFSQIDGPKNVSLLANFPYKQATLTISGTAFFHDLGKFVADFENEFPYVRVLNLSVEPVSALVANEREKLAFKMDVAALVKPTAP